MKKVIPETEIDKNNFIIFFSVFKSLYPINVGYNTCKAVCFKRQSNS